MELYKDVELTKEEELQAIIEAKRKKQADIKKAEYWREVNTPKVYPVYDAEELNALVLKKAHELIPGFVLDNFNEEIIFQLACYFTNDNRFEHSGFSLQKGLLLQGGIGCGKTSIMSLFASNQLQSFSIVNCHEISQEFSNNGYDEIDRYFTDLQTSTPQKYFGQDKLGFCFDDLGTEDVKKHFGNQSNVMAEIILSRYGRKEFLKHKTHITTNLSAQQIKDNYGDRVASRMREMFNQIKFDKECPDRRK